MLKPPTHGLQAVRGFPLCERGHSIQGTRVLGETWPLMIADHLFGCSESCSLLACCPSARIVIVIFRATPTHLSRSPAIALPALPSPTWLGSCYFTAGRRARKPLWIHLPGCAWALAKAPEKERTGRGWPATCCQGCHILPGPSVTRNATYKAFVPQTSTMLSSSESLYNLRSIRTCVQAFWSRQQNDNS